MSTAVVTEPRTTWFDRLITKIKRGAKAVAAWFTRTAKAAGRGIKAVAKGTVSVARTAGSLVVRGVGYLGRAVFATLGFIGTVALVALVAVAFVGFLVLLGWMEIITWIRFAVLYASDFFAWTSRKNRGTFRAVREENLARREARVERVVNRVADMLGNEDEGSVNGADEEIPERVFDVEEFLSNAHDAGLIIDTRRTPIIVDTDDEEDYQDAYGISIDDPLDHTDSSEIAIRALHGEDIDWDALPINRDLERIQRAVAEELDNPAEKAYLHARSVAVHAYLNTPKWDEQHKAMALSLMLKELRNLPYPAKALRRGFHEQCMAIDENTKEKAGV